MEEAIKKMDYEHTIAHQKTYDFSIYIHNKMKSLPHYEKFTLQKDIRETVDGILDELEMYEVTKVISHLYTADRLKRRLVRKVRLCHDLKYSGFNTTAYAYCCNEIGIIGGLIGGMIKAETEKKQQRK